MNRMGTTSAAATRAGPDSSSTPTPDVPVASPAAARPEPTVPRRMIGPILQVARLVNPSVLRLAGRRGVPFAVVHHSGRRSGRRYATPVVALPAAGGFVVSLPYGSGVSWCRNVLAGGASVGWQGVQHAVDRAEVLGAAEALPLLSGASRPVLRFLGMRQFLRLGIAPPGT